MKNHIFKKLSSLIVIGSVLLCACTGPAPEEAIKANIRSMQQAVENKKARDAVEFLSGQFVGNAHVDKMSIRRMLLAHFLRHTEIGVTITRLDIEMNEYDPYSASMHATLVVTGAENILPTNGKLLKVSGKWRYIDDDWLLMNADWE